MTRTRRALGVLFTAVSVTTAYAQTPHAAPQEGAPVKYPSRQAGAGDLFIDAMLYRPAGSARGAVVIVNPSGGWADFREGQYARALSSAGYAALTIDSYGPRGVMETYADNAKVNPYAQARDALAARKYLVSMGYPADRMAVMGSGRAGNHRPARFRPDVRPGRERAIRCRGRHQPRVRSSSESAEARLEDIHRHRRQERWRPALQGSREGICGGGRPVDLKVYPGAADGFDGSPNNLHMSRDAFAENFVECNVAVDPDGRAAYHGKTYGESETPALIVEMRKSCIKRGGFAWTNLTQKAAVTFDLIEFLDSNFRR